MKFIPKVPINNIPALVQIMAWRWPGYKPVTTGAWNMRFFLAFEKLPWNFYIFITQLFRSISPMKSSNCPLSNMSFHFQDWENALTFDITELITTLIFQKLHTRWMISQLLLIEANISFKKSSVKLSFVKIMSSWSILYLKVMVTLGHSHSHNKLMRLF